MIWVRVGSEASERVGQQQWCLVGGAAAAYVVVIRRHKAKGKRKKGHP